MVTAVDGSPEAEGTALVVIDMINTYDHEDAELLVPAVGRIVQAVADLIGEARKADVPVIYGNDNFGLWRSHHGELLDKALALPHAALVAARDALDAHYSAELGERFRTAGLCLYRDGRESVARHGDTIGRGSV